MGGWGSEAGSGEGHQGPQDAGEEVTRASHCHFSFVQSKAGRKAGRREALGPLLPSLSRLALSQAWKGMGAGGGGIDAKDK